MSVGRRGWRACSDRRLRRRSAKIDNPPMKISIFSLSILLTAGSLVSVRAETKIRVGHFPNVTHVQALVAHALSRQGKGWFEERLGGDTKIDWFVYNAGPSVMEAI